MFNDLLINYPTHVFGLIALYSAYEGMNEPAATLLPTYPALKAFLDRNASVFENDNLTNLNDKSFSKHMNVNLKAPALLTQNFKKYRLHKIN